MNTEEEATFSDPSELNYPPDQDGEGWRRFIDTGWLFILAGGVIVSAMVLIPPADDLAQLQIQREQLQAQVNEEAHRFEAYQSFTDALENEDPMLVRRLAVSELNLIPDDVEPIAMLVESSDGLDASVDDWIEETLPTSDTIAINGSSTGYDQPRETLLRKLATGPSRLWIMIAGMAAIFIGLLPPMRSGKG